MKISNNIIKFTIIIPFTPVLPSLTIKA